MVAETAERTIAVIAKFKNKPVEELTLETTLKELEMDSLDGLNLVFELEEEFDILIPDDKALTMKTIGEMVEGIELLLSGELPQANAASGAADGEPVKAEGS